MASLFTLSGRLSMPSKLYKDVTGAETGISMLFIAIYYSGDDDDCFESTLQHYHNHLMELSAKEFELFDVGLSKLDWPKVPSEDRCYRLSRYIIDLSMAFPKYASALITSLFTSFGTSSQDVIDVNDNCMKPSYSNASKHRLDTIK